MRDHRMLQRAVALMIVTACVLVPAAVGATGGGGGTPPVNADAPPVRLASSTERGVAFEVAVPWQQLAADPAGAGYVRVSLPAWPTTSQPGAPALPFLVQAIGVPHGAPLSVQVEAGPAHTVALAAPPLPAATRSVDWGPPEPGAGVPALPAPRLAIEADPAIYSGGAPYPGALAQVASDGVVRQQRVAGIALYPVQYNPATRELTVYEWLKVTVAFGEQPVLPVVNRPGGAGESAAYEELLRRELLNYEAARAWRQVLPPSVSQVSPERSAEDPAAIEGTDTGTAGAASLSSTTPWAPPNPGWRVKVREEGFYRLTYSELSAAGLPVTSLDPRTFRLYNLGGEVAIYVEGEGDGRFDSGDAIIFYGQPVASKYTRDNVYWLTYGQGNGLRMAARDGTPGAAETPAYYGARRQMEGNAYYLQKAPGDDDLERWMWDYVYPPSKPSWTHTFSLPAPKAVDYPARLKVVMFGFLQSPINPDHHVKILLNGTQVGEAWWDGNNWQTVEAQIAQEWLLAGNNTVTVLCPNDTGVGYDVVYVDSVELEYANTFRAESDVLAFRYDASGSSAKYQVDGFSSAQVAVYDVTDPTAVVRITGVSVAPSGLGYAAFFQDTVAAPARYWATAVTAYRPVLGIERDTASGLGAPSNGADYIVIAHKDFMAQAVRLRDWRAAQGLRAMLVDLQDVYDEFGYGITGAAPIHDFLAYAYASWQAPAPSFVLLVGDGHYDPKNYASTRVSYLPPYLAAADPWIVETAADNRYVTLVGADTMPDMMLGRLAVNSADEARAFVDKILAYEQTPPSGDWRGQVLAVADNADAAGNFAQLSDNLLSCCLPAPYQAEKVYYGITHTTVTAARTAIQTAINAGKLIVNYIGHAATTQWADEGLFKTSDVPLLQNGDRLPVMLPMTCYDGYYQRPDLPSAGKDALAEVVTRVAGKGAVASWSPTGLGVSTGHDYLDRGFFQAVFQQGLRTLGQATNAGKLNLWATGANLDLLDTYLLFGDPAMAIALPDSPTPTPTATPVTPTATPVTPTATPVTPTATPVTPTATPVTPTATPAPLTPMYMGNITMSYTLKAGKYTITAASNVLDASGNAVASATVAGRWTLPNRSTLDQQATSDSSGAVSFSITSKATGTYQFCVTNVTRSGYIYDPNANVETCDSLTVGTVAPTATPTPGTPPTATFTPTATPTGAAAPALHMAAIAMSYVVNGKTYAVTAASSVLDATGQPVASATVSGLWTLPDGTTTSQQALSGTNGAVSFKVSGKQTGTYQFCVTGIVKAGWAYDPASNVDTCKTIAVP